MTALRAAVCAALLVALPACTHRDLPPPVDHTTDLSSLFFPPAEQVHCLRAVTGAWVCSDGDNTPVSLR